MTGRVVEAGEALAVGLVSRVIAAEEFEPTVTELATQLAAGAPLAQAFIKTGLSRSPDMTLEQAIA